MKKRIVNVVLFIIAILITSFTFLYIIKLIDFKCVFKEIFNVYCAGCGTTRMVESILKLDLYQAFRYNPLMFILFIILGIYMIYQIFVYIKKGSILKINIKVLIIIAGLLIIYMIIRNISVFDFLKPIKI